MSKPVNFDEMIDPAFAETYYMALTLEKKGEIEDDMDGVEELSKKCKQIAADYVEIYEEACKMGCYPSFWDGLDSYVERRLKEMYPLSKHFDVIIDGNVSMTLPVFAKDKKEAEEQARRFMESPGFIERFRKDMRIFETEIGDVIE